MRHAIGGTGMDNHYLTANDHERYLDNLARSKAMCADKLRHGRCLQEQCDSCEKKKRLDACEAELAPYSRLLLDDYTDAEIARVIAAHPTVEEMERKDRIEKKARREAYAKFNRERSYEWFVYECGWMGYVALFIICPLIAILPWEQWV